MWRSESAHWHLFVAQITHGVEDCRAVGGEQILKRQGSQPDPRFLNHNDSSLHQVLFNCWQVGKENCELFFRTPWFPPEKYGAQPACRVFRHEPCEFHIRRYYNALFTKSSLANLGVRSSLESLVPHVSAVIARRLQPLCNSTGDGALSTRNFIRS